MAKKKVVIPDLFALYKEEVKRLLALASIGGDWDITFADIELCAEECGLLEFCTATRFACFAMDVEQCIELEQCPLATARHEFGHFVTAHLLALAMTRCVTSAQVMEAGEAVARTFETIFENIDK